MKRRSDLIVTVGILIGLVAGLIVGEVLFRSYGGAVPASTLEGLKFVGDTFFMRLLKMLLVPLVVSSVVAGVCSIGDPRKLGRVGGLTLLYYLSTMAAAVVLGVVLVTTLAPGTGVPESFRVEQITAFEQSTETTAQRVRDASGVGLLGAAKNILHQLIPSNPVKAAAEGQLLPLITFSLILGVVLTMIGERGRPLIDLFQSLFAAMMKLVEWVLWLAPLGVFCLIAWSVARIGTASLAGPLGLYMVTVFVGLVIHALVVLPLVLWLLGRTNPYRFLWQMKDALMTAFGTDSSSATLPVTLETAQDEGGCSKRASEFVLPLGATINMDG
ncbi:MAG: dicarboxylate/amino acid:cation symporter, partial [Phycisphaeraceae bacterium]|nr:dicarboxylate/amino acid:cation symporter [Phycisphaeraceae bacterium]